MHWRVWAVQPAGTGVIGLLFVVFLWRTKLGGCTQSEQLLGYLQRGQVRIILTESGEKAVLFLA